jgi:hypothetical protein
MRKAAENGDTEACLKLAGCMYGGHPYAREVGHVVQAAEVATSVGVMERHDVSLDVMTGVLHWLRKGGHNPSVVIEKLRSIALEGAEYCHNDGCEVKGLLKEFKVCPQCKTAQYGVPRARKRIGLRVGTRRRAAQRRTCPELSDHCIVNDPMQRRRIHQCI